MTGATGSDSTPLLGVSQPISMAKPTEKEVVMSDQVGFISICHFIGTMWKTSVIRFVWLGAKYVYDQFINAKYVYDQFIIIQLDGTLKSFNLYESEEEMETRLEVLRNVNSLVKRWVKEVSLTKVRI